MQGWLPEGQRARRFFVGAVAAGCLLLVLLQALVVPHVFGLKPPGVGDVVDQTLGDVIATALAATALGLLLISVFPDPRLPPVVENLPAHEIGRVLASALPQSKSWWFDGSTGRYQRSTTLPEMGRWARLDGTSRDVTIVVLDPRDEGLCSRYANYRRGLLSGKEQVWSVRSVRRDLYSTLLAALIFNEREPLTVTVAVKGTMSILRYDLSDTRLVITKEGRQDPAISCPAGSFYFDVYQENLRWALKQAQLIDLSRVVLSASEIDRDAVRTAFRAMNVYTAALDEDAFVDEVMAEATSTESPYS